jgi:DNA-binding NarL/FixJ family response regulator
VTVPARPVVVADARPVVAEGLAAALGAHPRLEAVAVCDPDRLTAALAARAGTTVVLLPPAGGRDPFTALVRTAAPAGTTVVLLGAGAGGPWPPGVVVQVLPAGCTATELADALASPGGRPASVPAPGPAVPADVLDDLTPRQRQVLALLAEGLPTPEIARRMAVSVNTVRTHVNVVLHRLGVHSRLRAVALYADGPGAGHLPPVDDGA